MMMMMMTVVKVYRKYSSSVLCLPKAKAVYIIVVKALLRRNQHQRIATKSAEEREGRLQLLYDAGIMCYLRMRQDNALLYTRCLLTPARQKCHAFAY